MIKSPFAIKRSFSLAATEPDAVSHPLFWFIFFKGELLLELHGEALALPCHQHLPLPEEAVIHRRPVGLYGESVCLALELDPNWRPDRRFVAMPRRQSYEHLGHDLWTIAGRASQLLDWHRLHQFCSACGGSLQELANETAKKCQKCGEIYYPRLSPAVIVSVVRGDDILLGRSPHFPPGMYSPLAGFVEPGEILEEAAAREVLEETGIIIEAIRYQASQPWPFPHSLMIGFTAAYRSGTITVDHNELEDARWFSKTSMPKRLPPPMSISRWLVDCFLAAERPDP